MLVNIFYHIDEFCKSLNKQIPNLNGKNKRSRMTLSEIMTIMIYFNHSGYKTFKDYYLKHVLIHLRGEFPELVSYTRFVELKKYAIMPLSMFTQLGMMNQCTGLSIIDSFSIKVCHNRRISSNKVFKDVAKRGKTSVGWFYGFKIHVIINQVGEIIAFHMTAGNVADNNQKVLDEITKDLWGKLAGDKGYIVNNLTLEMLISRGIQLITKVRSNMKNKLMLLEDKLFLKKRGLIESTGNILKNSLSLEHTRHRSQANFLAHICSCIVAYFFYENKPSMNLFDPEGIYAISN